MLLYYQSVQFPSLLHMYLCRPFCDLCLVFAVDLLLVAQNHGDATVYNATVAV